MEEGLTGQQLLLGLIDNLQYLYHFLQRPSPADDQRRPQEEDCEVQLELQSLQSDFISLSSQISECKKQKLLREHELSNKPKKPTSSFVFYFREQLKRRDHSSNEKEVSKLAKIISKEWSLLSDAEKEPYNIKAEESKRAYQESMKSFNCEHAEQIEEIQNLKRMANNKLRCLKRKKESKNEGFRKKYKKHKPKEPEPDIGIAKPKIPLSSFFLFFKENGPRISQAFKENRRSRLVQLASDQWKLMSKSEKLKYENIAKAKKEVYEKELQQYTTRANQILRQKIANPQKFGSFPSVIAAKGKAGEKQLDKAKTDMLKEEHSSNSSDSGKKEPDSLGQDVSSLSSTSSICDQELSSSSSYVEEPTPKPIKDVPQLEQTQTRQQLLQMEEEKPKKKCKRGKRSKESHQPKGPVSSFFLYYNCIVRELRKEFPELKGSELVKIASSRWALFPEEEKQIYQEEAKHGRELYDIQMDRFKKEYPEEASKLKYFQTKKGK